MKNQVVFELFWKFFSASCCYTPLREGHPAPAPAPAPDQGDQGGGHH